MLPAVLTCVFVIYLYRKLNDEEKPSPTSSDATASDGAEATLLADRIAQLELRINRLTQRDAEQEAHS